MVAATLCRLCIERDTSQAAIDAIPDDADIDDEMNVIELATAPVDELARLILRISPGNATNEAIVERARAWMDGYYWATAGGRLERRIAHDGKAVIRLPHRSAVRLLDFAKRI